MKLIFCSLCISTALAGIAFAQQASNAPPASASATNDLTDITKGIPQNATTEDLEKMVLKPPTSRAPISTTPTYVDTEAIPALSAEAQKHLYLGFRLGMSSEEAVLVAQTAGKKLDPVEEGKRYSMEGCLTDVPKGEKARMTLVFKEGKLDLIMVFWDDNNTLFVELERQLKRKYGKPEKVDELFRRYWILAHGDVIRLLYDVAARQTSLIYGSKQSVYENSEREKREIIKDFDGL